MVIRLSKEEMTQLVDAQRVINEFLKRVGAAKSADEGTVMGCDTCYGTCKDDCTGCKTCSNTSTSG